MEILLFMLSDKKDDVLQISEDALIPPSNSMKVIETGTFVDSNKLL